jgi:hypothetical protein
MGVVVGGLEVTAGLTTAVNDVLGLAGKGGVGLSVSGGRSLEEEERIGEEVDLDEETPVGGMAPSDDIVGAV